VIVENPSWMSGLAELNPALSLTYNRLYIFLFCAAGLRRAAAGPQAHRAGAAGARGVPEPAMARAMGVRSAGWTR
jgi:urea transport system permease protein